VLEPLLLLDDPPAMPPAVPLPVVGELDGRVPVVEPEAPPPVEFEALLPDGPQGLLLVPDWPLIPELPGEADGLEVEPPLVPDCAKATPALPAMSAAVKIARVDRVLVIICSLGTPPRAQRQVPVDVPEGTANYRATRDVGSSVARTT
jgi:hypothetical protein